MSHIDNKAPVNIPGPNTTTKEATALKNSQFNDKIKVRKGCKDIWNAYMADGAAFSPHDIPFCPTTATELPHALVTWEEAKAIYKKNISAGSDFKYDAFVCFYIDDYKFDGPRGIWHDSEHALAVLCHFAGVITPDFSTYQDFPEPIKIYATYRMRLMGYWLGRNGVAVINNVRWGTEETWSYCWDGVPHHSIVAVGTVASGLKLLENRPLFETGLREMVRVLQPHTVIVYGSANYKCFEELKNQGIKIVAFQGQMSSAFERRKGHE